jgi:hypothetical protein
MNEPLDAWIEELATALAVDPTSINRDLLLEASRSAHRVARAAAPFTAFLIGMAVGQSGGGIEAMTPAATTAQRLAAAHSETAE